MDIALIGNPNSGKTTLFNELTGANQHVGNWPGVTVEQKSGQIRSRYGEGNLIDLPGIYSLSPFSMEEIISRDYIVNNKPDVVINIVDATNLERNLYLTIQLIELNAPTVIALNMMDEVRAGGYHIDTARLSHDLGVPVIPISAAHREGISELLAALPKARAPKRHELPNPHLERLIALVEGLLREHLEREHHLGDAEAESYPLHWTAIKVLEGDELVIRHLTLDAATTERINELKRAFEDEYFPLSSAFAGARYGLIHHIIYHGVTVWSKDGSHHHHLKHAPQGYLQMSHESSSDIFSQPHANVDFEDELWNEEEDIRQLALASDSDDASWQVASEHGTEGEASSGTAPTQASAQPNDDDYARKQAKEAKQAKKARKRENKRAENQSDAIDKVLTHRIWAIPLFLLVMFAMFHLTFSEDLFFLGALFGLEPLPSPGVFLQGLVEQGITLFTDLIEPLFVPDSWSQSLVIDGIIGGVGAVLSFVPQILLLFLFLTLLEDCGYMARAAFIMDRFLRRFGLSGKSFLPMLMGFGCTVPAAMAARTMENENDRRLTLMLVPFMSCGARAPIFLVMAGAFFPAQADIVVFSMYLLGILVAVLSGILLRKLVFKGQFSPFIIELPRYRAPRLRSVSLTLWDKLKGYLVRAGTIIFAMCVVIWLFSSFGYVDGSLQMVDIDQSFLAAFGNFIAPVFTPLGFGTWIAAVAVLTGFIAKESVISTMGTLVGIGGDEALEGGGLNMDVLMGAGFANPLAALSFMVFCLLYIPCLAAFATLRKEFGSWQWSLGQAAYSIGVAYLFAFLVYQIGGLFVA